MKVTGYGRVIEGLPDERVLRHPEAPKEIGAALDAREEALLALAEEAARFRAAEKVAQGETLLVRGQRERWAAEIRDRVSDEARALRAAERRSAAAAAEVAEVVVEHLDTVRRLGALLVLEAHREQVDAALDAEEAGSRFSRFGGQGYGLRADLDPVLVARRASGTVRSGPLDDLDARNVHALAEAAGTRLDLVEVVGRGGVCLLTTPRRAEDLVSGSGGNWRHLDEMKEAGA